MKPPTSHKGILTSNRIRLLLILLLSASIHVKAQNFQLHGLEIYNPAYNNPAYTGAEKFIQADAIAYSNWYTRGVYSSVMATLPDEKNVLGVSFDRSGYFSSYSSQAGATEKTMSYSRLTLAYKRTFMPSQDLRIHAGAGINPAKLNYLEPGGGIDSSYQFNRYLSASIGAAVEYKYFTAGISAQIPVFGNRFYLDENNNLEKESVTSNTRSFQVYGKYDSQSKRRVTFDPVFGITWRYAKDSDFSEWLGYVGGHIQIVDVVGLGITAGSLVSVSATVNIVNRVELMLGIYAGEKLLDDGIRLMDYGLNFGNKEYIMQLRINL
jgi:hypothetical protein